MRDGQQVVNVNTEPGRDADDVRHSPDLDREGVCPGPGCMKPDPAAESVRPCQYWIDKLNVQSTRTVKVQRMADDLAEALYRLHHFGDPELVERALAAYKATQSDGYRCGDD